MDPRCTGLACSAALGVELQAKAASSAPPTLLLVSIQQGATATRAATAAPHAPTWESTQPSSALRSFSETRPLR